MIRKRNEESLDHCNAPLYAMGVSEEDTKRPAVGLVNSRNEMNPGHFLLKDAVAGMRGEIYKASGLALKLPVTGICDGICSNTPGNRYTLPAHDPVSSEVEMVAKLNMFEGMVITSTCDRVVPGIIMGALRVSIPTVMLTGGFVTARHTEEGKMLTLTYTKQVYAVYIVGDIDRDHYKMVVHNVCPTPGTYPLMGAASTMCTLAEILGLSPRSNASVRSQTSEWHEMVRSAARRLMQAVHDSIRPRSFIMQGSFENATHYIMAIGGSTNSLLYIPAIARQIGYKISPEAFDCISREVPAIGAIYPNHPTYTMEESSAVSGLDAVVRELAKADEVNTKCGGMSGTVGEKAELMHNNDTDVIRPVEESIHEQGGLTVLYDNTGSGSIVVKFSAVDPEAWKLNDPARCYGSQDDTWNAILRGEIVPGNMVVIHYEGPKGSPGMPYMETFMAAVLGKGAGKEIAFVSDGRSSDTASGLAIDYVNPEVYEGDNLALIENGDVTRIDIERHVFIIDVSDEEFDHRRASWKPVEKPAIGWLDLYHRDCTFAHEGATVYWKK